MRAAHHASPGAQCVSAQHLTWQLRHRWAALALWLVCIFGSLVAFGLLPKAFLPRGDSGFVRGSLVMPQGSSTEQIRAFQAAVIDILSKDPDVVQLGAMTGNSPGADQSSGNVFIRLRAPSERARSIEQCVQQFTKQLALLPYGACYLQPSPVLRISSGAESTASGSAYAYVLVGLDRERVYTASQELEAGMRGIRGLFGIQNNIKLNMPRLRIEIDRDRASSLGLTAQTIEQVLAAAFSGGHITQFMTDNDQYQIILEVAKEYQCLPDDLGLLYVRSPVTETLIPLKSVVRWREEASPQNIPHAQQQEAATVSFSLVPGVALGDAVKAIEDLAAKVIPAGVTGQFTGDALEFQKSIASLGIMLLVAIFLKYVMLGILYESYIHPFTILTTLPVAAFGGLLTLLICGRELSLYAYIGLFVLIGLFTKNGIMMVDFAKQRKREGMSSRDAIYDACLVRFRPILMTGLCAIFGILPIALGFGTDGASRVPLGLMVVGGMAFAQVITLFVTPGIYLYMEAIQTRLFTPRTDLE
ncbi:MAG: efflux RND transporter permease subunit [bacterium]|nr:efflux RND transporter permease subunit [bacterium]